MEQAIGSLIGGLGMTAKPTILGLMGVIACIAAGLAAVRSNDKFSAAAIFALTFAALCTSTLVAIYRRGAWAGFAVFGWGQFLICQPNTAPAVGPTSLLTEIAYRLLTCFHNTVPDVPFLFISPEFTRVMDVGDGKPILVAESERVGSFRGVIPVHGLRACLCLSSILVGFFGAIVGSFIARRCAGPPVPGGPTARELD
jgi:hypothetical protein